MRSRLLGFLVAAAILLGDQASKQWLLRGFDIADRQPVVLTSWFDVVLAWNRGISYSLFTTDSARGPVILLAVTLTVTAMLVFWLARADSFAVAVALGLIIGGALGNACDRYLYGAVVDFVHLHVGRFSWYIFNGADAAICVGVALILLGSLRSAPDAHASKMPEKAG